MDDLTELLKRIYEYEDAYCALNRRPPVFKITPYEYTLLKQFVRVHIPEYKQDAYGILPTLHGINFQLVGAPELFCGKHIRSDSGIDLTNATPKGE